MYTVLAVLITAGILWLTIMGARCTAVREMKKYLYINLILTVLSLVVGCVIPFLTHAKIFGGDYEEEWMDWAWDAFTLYLKLTLPLCGILLLMTCASVLFSAASSKKESAYSAVVRNSVSVASSVILLFAAPFYSAMAETENVPVDIYILIFGVCSALFLRLVSVIEMALRIRRAKAISAGR